MNISRRPKYEGMSRAEIKTDKRIDVNFNLDVLDLFCSYAISENRKIRKSHLLNLRNLMLTLKMDNYQSDIEKMKRINFILKALEGKLINNLRQKHMVVQYVSGGLMDEPIVNLDSIKEMSTEELDWVSKKITSVLNYRFIYENCDYAIDLFSRFKNGNYDCIEDIVLEIEQFCDLMKGEFRRNRVEKMEEMNFSLKNGQFEECMQDIHDILSSPSRRLRTGMQGLNELTNGGFENGRTYMFLGMTGVGKSLLLLNLIIQMKNANKHYQPVDPTKIPVIVMLTQENSVLETVQRMWNIVGFKESMIDYTIDEVVTKLRTEGELYISDASPIDIVIKYKGNRLIDTSHLYTMCEDLEDEGYEVIAIFQDHVKRIRSAYYSGSELRIELGEVVNEMKLFATIKDIPVITVSHLNRDGAKILDTNTTGTKADLTRMLGKANIGESMLMLDNIDFASIINIEYDSEMKKHIIFSRVKMRETSTQRNYIAYPFVDGNNAKIVEDITLPVPLFRETLRSDIDMGTKVATSIYSNVQEIEDSAEDRSIFSTMATYSSDAFISYPVNQMPQQSIPQQSPLPINDDLVPSDMIIPFTFDTIIEHIDYDDEKMSVAG